MRGRGLWRALCARVLPTRRSTWSRTASDLWRHADRPTLAAARPARPTPIANSPMKASCMPGHRRGHNQNAASNHRGRTRNRDKRRPAVDGPPTHAVRPPRHGDPRGCTSRLDAVNRSLAASDRGRRTAVGLWGQREVPRFYGCVQRSAVNAPKRPDRPPQTNDR
jgi:hypothetical protein